LNIVGLPFFWQWERRKYGVSSWWVVWLVRWSSDNWGRALLDITLQLHTLGAFCLLKLYINIYPVLLFSSDLPFSWLDLFDWNGMEGFAECFRSPMHVIYVNIPHATHCTLDRFAPDNARSRLHQLFQPTLPTMQVTDRRRFTNSNPGPDVPQSSIWTVTSSRIALVSAWKSCTKTAIVYCGLHHTPPSTSLTIHCHL
jgi:hypothetical protein